MHNLVGKRCPAALLTLGSYEHCSEFSSPWQPEVRKQSLFIKTNMDFPLHQSSNYPLFAWKTRGTSLQRLSKHAEFL